MRASADMLTGWLALGRVMESAEPDVSYAYDNLGRLTSASQTGNALSFTYDALNRNLTQVGPEGTVSSEWDLAGRRSRLTYPGTGLYVDYDYLVTGETLNEGIHLINPLKYSFSWAESYRPVSAAHHVPVIE